MHPHAAATLQAQTVEVIGQLRLSRLPAPRRTRSASTVLAPVRSTGSVLDPAGQEQRHRCRLHTGHRLNEESQAVFKSVLKITFGQ